MVLFVSVAAVLLAVPLLRGRLSALATLRLRATWALSAAALVQVAIMAAPASVDPLALRAGHLASYALAAVAVVANRRVPGLLLIALGGAANLAAIAANGGVMPASPAALRTAGLAATGEGFLNSAAVASPRLWLLGDVFAIPAGWPLANVFSVGDLLLVVGAAVLVHRTCGSRLPWSGRSRGSGTPRGSGEPLERGRGPLRGLRHDRAFVRLWGAQTVSGIGDWVFTLTVVAGMAEAGAAHLLATLLLLQVAPAALAGLLGGPWIDRLDRRRLMVGADVVRALAVATLLVAPQPALAHRYAVAVVLGVAGALFSPSLQASLPNVVARRDLVRANAALAATFHLAVTVGPLLGGILVTTVGPRPAFLLNALSFGVSAALVRGVVWARPQQRATVRHHALRDGLRYAAATPLVRGLLVVGALVMVASALKSPLEPLLVLETLGHPAAALGVVSAAWGAGMVAASLAGPRLVAAIPRERLLWVAVAVVGVAVVGAGQVTGLVPLIALWFVGGIGNGVGSLCQETLLQERTPELLRGRVIAASEAVLDGASVLGLLLAGWLGAVAGVRGGLVVTGALLLVVAALATRLVRPDRAVVAVEAGETASAPSAVVVPGAVDLAA